MAINSSENQSIDSRSWNDSKKTLLCNNESISSNASSKQQRKKFVSPYLNGDKVKLQSKVTEKKIVQRKTADFVSSFPLAANIYKANSDEFKIAKRASKKGKKCVHTLANGPVTQPCTVSDMNDSEYNETKISRKPKPKAKKRRVSKTLPDKNIQIYDRDARYCSEFNINLDSSSSDMFQHLTGDGRKVLKKSKNNYGRNQKIDNDVWAVLRNINKMQFIPSPPMSGASLESLKKKSTRRRSNDHSDASYIETCRTEEFAYISYDSTSLNSQSRSSSFDRITVIGKQDDVTKTYTYTKRDFREPVRKHEVVANHKKNRLTRNLNNNKTDQNDKQEIQQKSRIHTGFLRLQNNRLGEILSNKDENQKGTSENQMKAIDCETSRENTLFEEPEKSSITSELEHQEQLKGITRVVLSKGVDLHDSNNYYKQQEIKKTSLPNSGQQAKLTTTEIKRKLRNLKYPIVVTGKEKLSSFIQVIDYDPPQFSGLDKHIWPFMIKWLPESQKAAMCMERKKTFEYAPTHKINTKENGDVSNINLSAKPKNNDIIKHFKSKVNKNQISSQEVSHKEKPMRIFRDKMINLMYSNKYSIVKNTKNYNTKGNMIKVDLNSANIETQNYPTRSLLRKDKLFLPVPTIETLVTDKLNHKPKHTWSKIKWASDFIENVIKKVKCGVYYGQEGHKTVKDAEADAKSTQTDNLCDSIKVEKVKENKLDDNFYNGVIPGFEDTTQHLELKTVSKNQIAVKHCNTNVVVQFDIAFPVENNGILNKKDFISPPPMETCESRVFKYKATITNAVLPAELCSIIPQMLNNIFDSKTIPVLYQPVDNISLFPIKELTQHECLDSIKTSLCNIPITPHLKIIQNGSFSYTDKSNLLLKPKTLSHALGLSEIDKLLLELDTKILFDNITCLYKISTPTFQKITKHDETEIQKVNRCTALVPYVPRITTDLKKELNDVNPCVNLNLGFMDPLKVEYFGAETVVSLQDNSKKKINFVINNINCLFIHNYDILDHIHKSLFYNTKINLDDYEDKAELCTNKSRLVIKNKRKKCVKLCKKCKSTSSITHYKNSTPLQKIANLDEFFQALGSAKNLASVIDGDAERKILSSIVEMKSWIMEMTPRQALLILLLSNKKESSNIIRFRNVILQGIAMNRITKASELDMEIEVIERENLNNSVQFDGISYVAASAENRDTLLEELCWIAKTTASDYQRTFDKASERLLKSLLSKRKKLNPSYLRVMARYVGLGLLKTK